MFQRARKKAHETDCMSNLKQIATALIIYRDETVNQSYMSPWLSTLFPEKLDSKKVFVCKEDKNKPGTAASAWDPNPCDGGSDVFPNATNDYEEAYDRQGSVGLNSAPNDLSVGAEAIPGISYFYEFSDAKCGWDLSPSADLGAPNSYTWAQLKEVQIKKGNNGEPYDATLFPMVRCFWHVRAGVGSDAAPVLNGAYAGNVFKSRVKWELGVWTTF
jgi:hypothetical protein